MAACGLAYANRMMHSGRMWDFSKITTSEYMRAPGPHCALHSNTWSDTTSSARVVCRCAD